MQRLPSMMQDSSNHFSDVVDVARALQGVREVASVWPIVRGHLNRTYKVEVVGAGPRNLLVQRINNTIFTDVPALMNNISVVLNHLDGHPLYTGEVPRLREFSQGGVFLFEPKHGWWRAYEFLEGSESFDTVPSATHAESGAELCGSFTAALSDLTPGLLHDVLPGFQDSVARFRAGEAVVERASKYRIDKAQEEILALEQRKETAIRWQSRNVLDSLSLRPVHNDFKLNNVLFREGSSKARAVIDLDSCMPGYVYYDFGDLLRSTLLSCPEDCTDLSKVIINTEILTATVRGFVTGLGATVSPEEKAHYYDAPAALAYTLARRFLTDYLDDDRYFGAAWEDQNLRRARVQLRLGDLLLEKKELFRKLLAG